MEMEMAFMGGNSTARCAKVLEGGMERTD